MRCSILCLIVCFSLLLTSPFALPSRGEDTLHRIAFGSCYNPNKGDDIWKLIHSFSPNQLVLLGDQIYADFHPVYKYKHLNGSNPAMIELEYEKFYRQPGFKELTASLSHGWVSTYDDHDYGKDNGDRSFKHRDEAIALFSRYNKPFHFDDFVLLPDARTGELRKETKTGVFSSHEYSLNLPSSSSSFRYKLILLDARSNKDVKGTENGDFLGEQQWRWLEYELSEGNLKSVDLVILGSGIQMLSDDKLVEESWGEFPDKRLKLLDLLSAVADRRNVLLLSGDIHCAEISQMICRRRRGQGQGQGQATERRLVELTSSGLSHTFTKIMDYDRMVAERASHQPSQNAGREQVNIITKSRSYVAEFFSLAYQVVYPAVYRQDKYGHVYQGLHFGLIDLLHDDENGSSSSSGALKLRFQTMNHEGQAVMALDIPLAPLRSGAAADVSSEGAPEPLDCQPIQGELTSVTMLWFKANMVIGVMLFIILPVLTLLWFVGAALYFLCIGRELERRERIERNYQALAQQKKEQ